jgi:hypothetical protein
MNLRHAFSISLILCSNVYAQWDLAFDGLKNNHQWYWDLDERFEDPDNQIIQIPVIGSNDAGSVWDLIQFDCKNQEYRILVTMYYDQPLAKGKPAIVERIPKWEKTKLNSPFGEMLKIICGKFKR